jgi:hypothetical protein
MPGNNTAIPLPAVRLLIGYFSHTSTWDQRQALDEWICTDDANMETFEECLEITLRPRQPDPDRDEGYHRLWFAAELLIKQRKNILDPEEKQALEEWLIASLISRDFFRELPDTDDQKVIYGCLVQKWNETEGRMKIN